MRRSLLLAVVSLIALALVACGDSDDSSDTAAENGSPTTAAAAATIAVADSSLGKILVDAKGRTLYLFTKDSGGKSTCEGSCAELWPPLTAAATKAGDGVDGAKLSTITRPDGTKQAAYFGQPLYYYAQDAAAGDVKGQGVGGVWYPVRPDGTPTITGAAGGGY